MNPILSHLPILIGAAAGAVVLLVALNRLAKVARRASRKRIVTVGLLVPAAMALGLSASTSYRYVGVHLGITDLVERLTLCATVEAAIIALTVHSWGAKSKSSAWLAYSFIGVQAIASLEVSGGAGGIFRIAAGPVLLALLLHRLLGLELKFSGEVSTGLFASLGREIRERLTARLGIGRRGADSAAIARSRSADRAVALASGRRFGRRKAARLAVAIDAAQHGLNEADAATAEASIVARVVRRRSVEGLHGITDRHVWSATPAAGSNASLNTGSNGSSDPAPAEAPLRAIEPVIFDVSNRRPVPSFTSFTSQANPFTPNASPVPSQAPADPVEAALTLHAQGVSFGQIGDRLGKSKTWAYNTVTSANGATV